VEKENQAKKIIVHPSAVVAADVKLEEGVLIGPNCVVERGCSIGQGTKLIANVYIGPNVTIGKNNNFFPNSSIGCPPQVLGFGLETPFGELVIGDNNVIREQATIHPSMHTGHQTKIGNNNLIMVGVHIGHDCLLENNLVLSNLVQISGHCKIETGVWFSGVVLVHQFITIGRWCYAAAIAGINHDVPPFLIVSGHYPPIVRGVNKRGLKRAGLTDEQQRKIFDAYRRLYRSQKPLLENARQLAAEDGLDENVRDMVNAILRSSEHRFGRYLETFRE
jgi:UDP-N-acetylglucosamine acyltransferase